MSDVRAASVLIVGSGTAGCTAAIYAARAGLSPVLVCGLQIGGQLTITTDVENFPGFAKPVQGPWLMDQMHAQALAVGTRMVSGVVQEVDFSSSPLSCRVDDGTNWHAKSVIVATGARAKWLSIEGEERYRGRGISACATCDGTFFRNQDVAVIGGGNSAVEEALYLSNICRSVLLIHRRDKLRAEKILQNRLSANAKVTVLWNHAACAFLGSSGGLEGVRLKHVRTNATHTIALKGVFVAIGHKPETEIFLKHLQCDAFGYIKTKRCSTTTSRRGVFAAGDCVDSVFRQAVTAAAMGCMAALEAEKYLSALAA